MSAKDQFVKLVVMLEDHLKTVCRIKLSVAYRGDAQLDNYRIDRSWFDLQIIEPRRLQVQKRNRGEGV